MDRYKAKQLENRRPSMRARLESIKLNIFKHPFLYYFAPKWNS
jgi:hypothetical protein